MLLRLGKVATWSIAGIVFLLLIVAWALSISESRAEKSARDFCASVRPGDLADDVVKKAVAIGESAMFMRLPSQQGSNESLDVTFTGPFPFSYHSCSIEVASKHVASTKYVHFD